MKIGLIQVDGKYPNLALMKITNYHKKDNIEWVNYFNKYDIIYSSKLFNFSKEDITCLNTKELIKGGSGFDISKKLPDHIENSDVDYSIYPKCNYSLQMFSRGCIRKCPFCIVYEKEGNIKPINPISLNPKGKWIEILDNNFFANPEWKSAINMLLKWNQKVNFHGIDLRIINEEQAYYLNKLKHYKQIHIAWDNPKDDLLPKIKEMLKFIKPYKIMCYVLIGYWSTQEEDQYRVKELYNLGITPFVIPYNNKDNYQKRFSRFVNRMQIFKSCNGDFNKYIN